MAGAGSEFSLQAASQWAASRPEKFMLTPITIVIYKTTEEGCPVRSVPGQASIAMRKVPKIAESEWKVMKILWSRREPQAAYDIIQQLSAKEDWHARTVKTLLGRLVKKGAVAYKKYKNLYLYYPRVSEAECVKAESASFLARCFDGSLQPMLAYFVQGQKLAPEEIRELKKILERKERGS